MSLTDQVPGSVAEITLPVLNRLVSEKWPGATVERFEVREELRKGKMVSTAGRVRMSLRYGPGSPPLPTEVVAKMVLNEPSVVRFLYETEVQMYRTFLPRTDIEQPTCLGAAYDPSTGNFMLLLEDLSRRGAFFPTVLDPPLSPDQVSRLLDVLAKLHAQYWEDPGLLGEARWLGGPADGAQFAFFDQHAARNLRALVDASPYRSDLITRVGRSPEDLWNLVRAVHVHQASATPLTLVHGDAGAHNSYHLPDSHAGYLDWQFSSRGSWARDVHYLVCTALSVYDRRLHERDLVQHYLNRLSMFGVSNAPSLDVAMREFGRAIIWGFTIGWLIVPERNYGMEIIGANLERLYAAICDHSTLRLAEEVM